MGEKIEVVIVNPAAQQEAAYARNVIGLLFIGVSGLILLWIHDVIIHWQTYPAPYKYVLAFYYYTLVLPIHSFFMMWYWLQGWHITPFVNINFIITLIGMVIYALCFLSMGSILFQYLKTKNIKKEVIIAFYTFPIVLSVLWFIIKGVFSWIFAIK